MIIPEQAVELLPCPFCGEAMEVRGDYTDEAAWNYFEHANAIDSKCILKDHTINAPDFRTPDAAEAAEWNKRAQPLMGVQRPEDVARAPLPEFIVRQRKKLKEIRGNTQYAKGYGDALSA